MPDTTKKLPAPQPAKQSEPPSLWAKLALEHMGIDPALYNLGDPEAKTSSSPESGNHSDRRAAQLKQARDSLHQEALEGNKNPSLFLLDAGITEEELSNIFFECDVPAKIAEVFQSQIDFMADHASERWPEVKQTSEQIRKAGHLVYAQLYNDLPKSLAEVTLCLLFIKFLDALGLPLPEATLNMLRRQVGATLFKTQTPVRRRKGSGRPAKITANHLERNVKSVARKVKRAGLPVTLANVSARLDPPLSADALSSKLADKGLIWRAIKYVIINE
jgi:hypothetical protein